MKRIAAILALALVSPVVPAHAECASIAWADPAGDSYARNLGAVTGSTTDPVDLMGASVVATTEGTDVTFSVVEVVRPTGPIEAALGYVLEYRSGDHSYRAFVQLTEDGTFAGVADHRPDRELIEEPVKHPADATVTSDSITLHMPSGTGMEAGASITGFDLYTQEEFFADPTGTQWTGGISSSPSDFLQDVGPEGRSFSVPSC